MGGLLAPKSPPDRTGRRVSRRTAIGSAGALAFAALTGARPANAADTAAGAIPIANPAAATPLPTGPIGYVFNVQTQDVTLFDPATRAVIATKPLGAVVQWLSNEQRFWDGRHIWTYDFPEDVVRAIAIDPRKIALDRALPSGGSGPAHSLMLTPDLREAWVNVAGSDYLAIFDLASGEVAGEVKTGKFP